MAVSAVLGFQIFLCNFLLCSMYPLQEPTKDIQPRQLEITRTKDGGYQYTFSLANAYDIAGQKGSIAASQTYNIGPKGSSSAGTSAASFNGNSPGLNFGYSQSSAQAQNQNQFGSSNAASNAFANNIQTPFSSSADQNANSFANTNEFSNVYPNRGRFFKKRIPNSS